MLDPPAINHTKVMNLPKDCLSAMTPINGPVRNTDQADFMLELAEIEAESMGWLALGEGCYLHLGSKPSEILIVGTANVTMAADHVLWVY